MNGKRQVSKKLVLAAAVGLVALVPMSAMAANKLIVNGTDGVTPKFVVTDTGYVGVGTSTPAVPVHAVGYSVVTSQIRSQNIHPTAPTPGTPVTGEGGGFVGYFDYPNGGLPVQGDRLGYFLFGSNGNNQAGFNVYAAGDWSSTSMPTEFVFTTTPVGSAGYLARINRMKITNDGNVEVYGGVRLTNTLTQPSCDSSHQGTLWFTQGTSGAKDTLQVCASDGTSLAWRTLY
jgi:hypothetical protein